MKTRNGYLLILIVSVFLTFVVCGYWSAVYHWHDYQHALKYSQADGFSLLVKEEILKAIPQAIFMLMFFIIPIGIFGPGDSEGPRWSLGLLAGLSPPLLLMPANWIYYEYFSGTYPSEVPPAVILLLAWPLVLGPAIVGTIICRNHKRSSTPPSESQPN